MRIEKNCLGRSIVCEYTMLDAGIHVLLYGGDRSHVGAVSISRDGEEPETILLPGHKENYITVPWAKKLALASGKTACVAAGIHYDDASREMIGEIMAAVDEMLEETLVCISPAQ